MTSAAETNLTSSPEVTDELWDFEAFFSTTDGEAIDGEDWWKSDSVATAFLNEQSDDAKLFDDFLQEESPKKSDVTIAKVSADKSASNETEQVKVEETTFSYRRQDAETDGTQDEDEGNDRVSSNDQNILGTAGLDDNTAWASMGASNRPPPIITQRINAASTPQSDAWSPLRMSSFEKGMRLTSPSGEDLSRYHVKSSGKEDDHLVSQYESDADIPSLTEEDIFAMMQAESELLQKESSKSSLGKSGSNRMRKIAPNPNIQPSMMQSESYFGQYFQLPHKVPDQGSLDYSLNNSDEVASMYAQAQMTAHESNNMPYYPISSLDNLSNFDANVLEQAVQLSAAQKNALLASQAANYQAKAVAAMTMAKTSFKQSDFMQTFTPEQVVPMSLINSDVQKPRQTKTVGLGGKAPPPVITTSVIGPPHPTTGAAKISKISITPDISDFKLVQIFHTFCDPTTNTLTLPQFHLMMERHQIREAFDKENGDDLFSQAVTVSPEWQQTFELLDTANDGYINLEKFMSSFQICNRCTEAKRRAHSAYCASHGKKYEPTALEKQLMEDISPVLVRAVPTTFEGTKIRSCEHYQWTWCEGFEKTGNEKCKGTNRHDKCPKYLANCTLWKHKLPPKQQRKFSGRDLRDIESPTKKLKHFA